MLISDIIQVNPVPQVITLSEIASLKRSLQEASGLDKDTKAQLEGLLQGYLVSDKDNRRAIESILGSLFQEAGKAFLISGPYGAGKSHLLAVVSLLADHPFCWQYFLSTHNEFARFAPQKQGKFLVVQISLDEFPGPSHNLEDIVFAETEKELKSPRHNAWMPLVELSYFLDLFEKKALPGHEVEWQEYFAKRNPVASWETIKAADSSAAAKMAQGFLQQIGLPLNFRRSRAETLATLFQNLNQRGYAGAILLLDELSTFLASKDKRALNQDASFLQFISQQCTNLPLWLIATAQRSLEDIGDIDSHTLRQVRDRLQRFTLSISEIRRVIAQKLIQKPQPEIFASEIAKLYHRYSEIGGKLSFFTDELAQTYPINPLVLDCLEAISANFLSSTRGLIGMVQRNLLDDSNEGLLNEEADYLLTLDRVFDLETPELFALPEAQKFRQAWEFFNRNLNSFLDSADISKAMIIVKTMFLLSMANLRWPSKHLSEAMIGCGERTLWANWAEVERILGRLWRKGAYIGLVRGGEAGANEYFLEVGSDLSELVRRRMNEALAALSDTDERLCQGGLSACSEDFPLGDFLSPRSVGIEWMGVRRYVNIAYRNFSNPQKDEFSNMILSLQTPLCREDGTLFFAALCREPAKEKQTWRSNICRNENRFQHAVLAWFHRPPTENEWEIIREHAALNLLLADPTLSSTRKGKEVLIRLKERLSSVREECQRTIRRLYLEGEVISADGNFSVVPATRGTNAWQEILEDIFSQPFRQLFPGFAAVAPRQRLVGRLHTNQIIERFLKPGRITLASLGSFEEHLKNYLEPLEFLNKTIEGYTLNIPDITLVKQVLSQLPAPTQEPQPESVIHFCELQGKLQKSELGLVPEMAELVVGGLLRAGYLRGLDGFLSPIHISQIAAPLCDNLPYVMRSSPLSETEQVWLMAFGRRILGLEISTITISSQEALWDPLREWRGRALSDMPEIENSLHECINLFGQEEIRWTESLCILRQISSLLSKDISHAASAPGLSEFLEQGRRVFDKPEAILEAMQRFSALREFLRSSPRFLQTAFTYLSDSRLQLPDNPSLEKQRATLLRAIAEGEAMIPSAAKLVSIWQRFHHSYQVRYRAWHNLQHSPTRYRPFIEIKAGAPYQLARRLTAILPEQAEKFTELTARLDQVISCFCPGTEITSALASSPVCPQCGLRLRGKVEIPEAKDFSLGINKIIESLLDSFFVPEILTSLRQRLEAEPRDELQRNLEAILSLSPQSEAAALLQAFTPAAVEWIARQINSSVKAKRKAEMLTAQLRQRQLIKRQAIRIFHSWLDEQGNLDEDDLIEIE